ncbi:hypothetical protein [Psychroserpens damuponensis]|uniref:hypothetical protein n=1 Tax=Psychroserpens damuponensis TaxID=943936 RepID=UPI00058AC8AD|nr:hypothetical protein [Psychroserpens damuponensis]
MKSIIILLILTFLSSCQKEEQIKMNFDCEYKRACFEFEKKLNLVHDFNYLLKALVNNELEIAQRWQ